MDQPYSFWADWLSKFHTASELIQALWLVALSVTALGITWCVMHGLVQIVSITARCRWAYGPDRHREGRWLIHGHGPRPQELDGNAPPPGLIGHHHLVQGRAGRPE